MTSRLSARRGGILINLVLLLCGACALAALAWMLFLPRAVIGAWEQATGCPLTIASLYGNPITGEFRASGVTVRNPEGFPAQDFVVLRELSARADVGTLQDAKRVFERVVVDIEKIVPARGADGVSNLLRARQVLAQAGRARTASLLIKRLEVRYAPTGFKRTYTDVTDLAAVLVDVVSSPPPAPPVAPAPVPAPAPRVKTLVEILEESRKR